MDRMIYVAMSGAKQMLTQQAVVANNLANANTPGYRRVDVDFHGALGRALAAGDGTRAALERAAFAPATDATGALRADGSTVDPDAEAAKLAANALEHQAAVQIAATRNAILGIAMGVR